MEARNYLRRHALIHAAAVLAVAGASFSLGLSLPACLAAISSVLAVSFLAARRHVLAAWAEMQESVAGMRRDLDAESRSLTAQRAEQDTLMGAISDAIVAVDHEHRVLFFNRRFALQFGGPAPGSRTLVELFREPALLDAFAAALSGNPASLQALPLERDGARRHFSVSVAPLREGRGAGQVYGAVGVFHDVSDLKLAEQMRIDFVANVSHELRTPLTAIKGYADTLAQDAAAGRPLEKSFVERLSRNTERLMSLIQDLLDLSSLESGETIQKTKVETDEITRRVLRQLQGAFDAKRQTLTVRSAERWVWADPGKLEQVLVNLLDNASKYTPAGGKIAVGWEAGDAGECVLAVRDTGPGIPVEHQARLFERFYRVDRARSRELGGTGLGLAIVKHIVQRHGGSVSVESRPGEGACFTCRFPARH